MKSSAIEGENLNPEEVRSSNARRLGLDTAGIIPASRDVEDLAKEFEYKPRTPVKEVVQNFTKLYQNYHTLW